MSAPVAVRRTSTGLTICLIAPSGERAGGQAMQARDLRGHLSREGYDVRLIPIDAAFPKPLGWVRRVPYARTLLNEALYVPSLGGLRDVDVVHVFCASYWSFLISAVPALEASRRLGKRVILNYHSGEAPDHFQKWGAILHHWLRRADEIVVPSRYLQGVFAEHGHRVSVVPNFVDLTALPFMRRGRWRPRFLSNRNLEAIYDVENTLRSFALIARRYPDATLVVAGAGSQAKRLQLLAQRLRLTNIDFVGSVSSEEMSCLYRSCDVLLNSSVVDNQPLSVLEAFAAGLAVVSTATGDLTNLVRDGDTGRVVAPREPTAMASAAVAALENPQTTTAMAMKARGEVEARHSWSAVHAGWASVYFRSSNAQHRAREATC